MSAAGEIRRGRLAWPQDPARLLRLSRRQAGADAVRRRDVVPFASRSSRSPAFVNSWPIICPRWRIAYGYEYGQRHTCRSVGQLADAGRHHGPETHPRWGETRGHDPVGDRPAERLVTSQCRRRHRRQSRRHGLRRGRGRDQLDGVRTVPLGGPGNVGDFTALTVDQNRGRHPQRQAVAFEVLKHPGLSIAEKAELGEITVLEEFPGLFWIAGVDIDRDDCEFVAAELALQAIQRRHFLAAGHAPGRPQVQENYAPLPVRQLFRLAGAVDEG